MIAACRLVPPGPTESYNPSDNLLSWMADQFDRFGDTFKASVYGTNAYITRLPEHAEHVLRHNWRNYVKGQAIKRVALLLGSGLMVSEGELWKRQRRMIQPAFHATAIENLTRIIVHGNQELLAEWERAAERRESVDVTADVSRLILKITLLSIFGEDYDRIGPEFRVLSDEAGRSLGFAQAFRAVGNLVRDVIGRRRAEGCGGGDILGMLMQARDRDTGEGMTDRQLINEAMTLVVAGHETTASTLNWIWYLLSRHPEAGDALASEVSGLTRNIPLNLHELPRFRHTRNIIDETLRLYPAGWLMTRKALHDDQLGSYFVPAGTEIYIPPYFIQRNPRFWDEPERFNPDRLMSDDSQSRPRLANLPFSAGPRNCIGELFARTEMQIHLMIIAKRMRLRYFEEQPPEFEIGVNLRSKQNFVMWPEIRA